MTPVRISLIETLALAAVGLLLGRLLLRRVAWMRRLCLPEPVLGGLGMGAVFGLIEASGRVTLQFDLALQTPLMIAFFLAIGWMASWSHLRRGGPMVLKFLGFCAVVLVSQNLIGMGIATLLGREPLLGVLSGSVSLAGGPGTALAFAPGFEKAGVSGAGPIGTACALAGIVTGGLMGAPFTARLIRRHALEVPGLAKDAGEADTEALAESARGASPMLVHLVFFPIVMAVGCWIGEWARARGLTLPVYIGAMLVAAVGRNLHDALRARGRGIGLSDGWIEEIGAVALAFFLVVATMTLQLRALADLAGVLVLILAVQAAWIWWIAQRVFRGFGGDYQAAVTAGGFIGFMMGTTANAMANMNAVTRRHGPAPRAFLVVPLVGACAIDFVNAVVITLALAWAG